MIAIEAPSYAEVLNVNASRTASDEGRFVAKMVVDLRSALRGAISLSPAKGRNIDPLLETFAETSAQGWDGYEARPVVNATVNKAWQFIQTLPAHLPDPEISADPDGDIALDWMESRDRMLSVSIRDNGDLHYAGVFGRSKVHGVDSFDDAIPEVLLQAIARVYA